MKTRIRIIALALTLLMLCACSAPAAEKKEPEDSGGLAVQLDPLCSSLSEDNARVFYEIFVGSFSDSNGDGIGDLRGIINRVDYLTDLGVEGLWLTPIFRSPSYHKYDVADFYEIDPQFGTMDDLRELLDVFHERDIKVILDLPINHTSTQNEWFKSFRNARKEGNTGDPYYYFYSCCSNNAPAPAGRAFYSLAGTNFRYEGNFTSEMPEINFDNYQVRIAMLDVARYYLDLGVDGFRFDAAKYIYFGDNAASLAFWEWYIGKLREVRPDVYTVAEVWDGSGVVDIYTAATNCFDFGCSQPDGIIARTAKGGDVNAFAAYVADCVSRIRNSNPAGMMVPFITNHDMDRAAGFLTVSSGTMAMAANLYLLSSGSPFIYYGEEIGLKGSRGGANTDANRRLHMLWGDGDTVADPEGSTYSSQADTSAAEQLSDENSLLTRYRRLLRIRRANPEIARGDYTALKFEGTKLGGFISEWNGGSVCVLHNTTDEPITVDLRRAGAGDFSQISACIGEGEATLDGDLLTLGGRTSVVLRK